jgi:putative DNA primase/helicase
MTFNILEHLGKLTPDKGKDRYICPVCNGNNLTIAPSTGKYKCWSGCECKDIRDAISPKSDRPIQGGVS